MSYQSALLRRQMAPDASGTAFDFLSIEHPGCHTTAMGLLLEPFGFCGCGQPEEVLRQLTEPAAFIRSRSELPSSERWPEMPEKYLLALYVLDAGEVTEHGSSVFGSWLTEFGKEWLDAADEVLAAED